MNESSSKKLWKTIAIATGISADDYGKAKTIKKEKIWLAVASYLTNFYEKYLQNLKYNVGIYFSFDFGWYSIHFGSVRYVLKH